MRDRECKLNMQTATIKAWHPFHLIRAATLSFSPALDESPVLKQVSVNSTKIRRRLKISTRLFLPSCYSFSALCLRHLIDTLTPRASASPPVSLWHALAGRAFSLFASQRRLPETHRARYNAAASWERAPATSDQGHPEISAAASARGRRRGSPGRRGSVCRRGRWRPQHLGRRHRSRRGAGSRRRWRGGPGPAALRAAPGGGAGAAKLPEVSGGPRRVAGGSPPRSARPREAAPGRAPGRSRPANAGLWGGTQPPAEQWPPKFWLSAV